MQHGRRFRGDCPLRSKILVALFAASLLLGCRARSTPPIQAHPPGPAPQSTVDWLRGHAVPLRSEDPEAGDGDLALLGQAIGTARVVGLGEATHGTRQFFRMKHRLLQYLVRRRGFTTFAMEADGAASCDIDDYVHTGTGDPVALIRELKFWTWDTKEILDMIRWMRAYNATVGPDRTVGFHGIDMQNPLSSSRKVVSFLRQVDPRAAHQAESAYHCLDPLDDPKAIAARYPYREVQEQVDCARGIGEIYQRIARNRTAYERRSPSAYSCALLGAKLMMEDELLLRVQSVRDHHSAENVLALLEPGRKVIVWAHNMHIAKGFGAMGRTLARQLGEDYVAIGFDYWGGSFRARPRRADGGAAGAPIAIRAPVPSADSYEQAFHRAGLPIFFLDLRPLKSPFLSTAWLAGQHPMWSVGGGYDPAHSVAQTRLPDNFDYLIFFDQAQASELF